MGAAVGVGGPAGTGNGAAVMPSSGFAAKSGMVAGGKFANGRDSTFVDEFPTAVGVTGVVLGACMNTEAGALVGPGGAATAPMRRGLLPLRGTVFAGVDARGATVGSVMGRVKPVEEGSPEFDGGQGKPAMR